MLSRKLYFAVVFVLLVSISSFSPKTSLAFLCAFEDTANISICSLLRPPTDTIHTLAIYCTGYDSAGVLPSYWASIWSDTADISVPGFFRDNSNGKYILHCDPLVDFVNGDACVFQHSSLSPNLEVCQGGGNLFADSIFLMVDSVVNFANYDQDQDGIVDGFVFIIVNATTYSDWVCPCLGDFSYKTQNTLLPV